MTRDQWLTSTDPIAMLAKVRAEPNSRKTLLYTCACAARYGRRLRDGSRRERLLREDLRDWCSIAARVAEGRAREDELEPLGAGVGYAMPGYGAGAGELGRIIECAWLDPEYGPDSEDRMTPADRREQAAQAALVREVFGDPFLRIRVKRAWRTPEVVSLARAIYGKRAFGRMPELAGALGRAGCTTTAILDHCRGSRPHVRGCWVIDQLLDGRSLPVPRPS